MTSLPKSSPAGPELARALEAAIVQVGEESFAAFTEVCGAPRFRDLTSRALFTGADWMRATLAFSGPFHGELTVDVPETLALELLASCVGIDGEDGEALPAVEDAVGELANMVCGTWLTRHYKSERFDLRPPRVDRLEAANVERLWTAEADGAVLVGFNDQPVRIRLVV